MCELFIELLTARLQHDPVPFNLLHTLGREGGGGIVIYNYFTGKFREFYFNKNNFRLPEKSSLSFFWDENPWFFSRNCPKGRKLT